MSGMGFLRKNHQATKAHLARPAKKTTKVCKVGPAKKVEKVRKARLAMKAKKTSKVSLTLGVGQPGARFFSLEQHSCGPPPTSLSATH